MADWGILRNTGNDFLSSLASFGNHDNGSLNSFHMMNSFIDRTFSSSIYDENSFCTPDNVDQCVTHLSQELTNLGLKPLSHEGSARTTSLINGLNEVLRMYQRSSRIKEELENRLQRSSCDNTENQTIIRRLRADKDRLEREVAQEKEKLRQTHTKMKGFTSKLKTEKDEVKRLQSVVKDRDAQYKHELKKKQREVNKLMERLHQLLMDKNPDRRIGMDMVGLLHRGDSKRSKWKGPGSTGNKQEEMYQLLVSNYEEKQQELRVENSDLRDCLLDMQRELLQLVDTTDPAVNVNNSQNGALSASSSETDLSSASSLSHDLTDDYFQMPYDMLRENLHRSFQDTCKKIRENVRKCSHNSQNGRVLDNHSSPRKTPSKSASHSRSPSHIVDVRESERRNEELEKLKKQIDKYKDIVKQQETLIQQSLHTQSKSMENSFLQESQILQEKESLSEQRRRLYQEKADFEEERRKFSESALHLQHEKKQLEEEKKSLLQSHILNMSPVTSKPPSPKSAKGDRTRLLPSTPMFSPAPTISATTDILRMKMLALSLNKSAGKEKGASKRSLPQMDSLDSLTSSSRSAHSARSAPSDLRQQTTSSSKQLSFDSMDQIEHSMSGKHRRSYSAGSKSSLDEL